LKKDVIGSFLEVVGLGEHWLVNGILDFDLFAKLPGQIGILVKVNLR
jgi:hypothetical protein